MNANLWKQLGRLTRGLTAGAAIGAIALTAQSQETPAPLPKPSPVAAPAADPPKDEGKATAEKSREQVRDKAEEARDTAKAVRKGARETAEGAREITREARQDEGRKGARDTAEKAREITREGRQEARSTIRDARADVREARRDLRAADLGLWFNGRAGTTGLVIADIASQGGISKAGFMEGDRIVSVNGTPVTTEAEFTRLLTDDSVKNQQVKVVVMRGDKEQVINVQPSHLMEEVANYDPLWQYGLIVDDRVKDRVVVQRVFPRTPAYYAGLRAGDTVVGVRGQRLAAVADLARALAQNADRLAVQISRGNQTRDLQIESTRATGEVQTTLKPQVDEQGRPITTPADRQPRLDRTPATPANPATPATPATPARPSTPTNPATPATPARPATPAAPAAPATSPAPATP